jgi:hypothetical protein
LSSTEFQLVADTLAGYLGISCSLLTTILFLAVAATLGLTFIRFTGSVLLGSIPSVGVVIIGGFLGFLPLWVVLLLILIVTALVMTTRLFGPTEVTWGAESDSIATIVGVSLIPTIMDSTKTIVEEEGADSAISSLVSILPYIFVAIVLLGTVAWLGGGIGGSTEEKEERREKVKEFFKNPKEVILRIENSSRNWEKYTNNLDKLLNIVTKLSTYIPKGLLLSKDLLPDGRRELWIDTGYDWYIADKCPGQDIFKIVGLNKKDSRLNVVYVLGVGEDSNTFLKEVPTDRFLEASCKSCCDWMVVKEQEEKW